jgi:ABC-type nitrate/sulfonate/bicarbonate transport system substrate-binding protein
MSVKRTLTIAFATAIAGIVAAVAAPPERYSQALAASAQQGLPVLTVTVFAAPSQVVWFPALIQKTGLDVRHGFKLEVKQKPAQMAYADFASGADPVCYCISTGAGGRFVEQGADIELLWTIFNYDYFIVSANPAVQSVKDLEGKTLVADTVTGSRAIADWFLQQRGVDLSKVHLQSSNVHGAGGFAELLTGRADGVAVTPIDASAVLADAEGSLRVLPVYDPVVWQRHANSPTLPSIAAGAWRSWAAKPEHLDLLRRFYAANLDAVGLVKDDPEKSAELIEQATGISRTTLVHYFRHFNNLINIRPIDDDRESIAALTQKILPEAKQLDRPLTASEFKAYVSDFRPQ